MTELERLLRAENVRLRAALILAAWREGGLALSHHCEAVRLEKEIPRRQVEVVGPATEYGKGA